MVKWPTKPIGELCKLINGRAFKPAEWETEGLPIVRIQNLNDHSKPFNKFSGHYSEKHYLDNGEILLSWSGTPGTSFGCFRWLRGPGLLNQHIFKVLVAEDEMDGDFFIYAVNSRLDEMIRQAHGGVGLRHITKTKLEAIHLPVPQVDEQRRIVARIKECMERVEEIEGLRTEAMKEADSLAPSLYAAIEDEQHWPMKTVGDVVLKSRNGKSIRPDNKNFTGYVLSISAVHDVTLNLDSPKPIVLPEKVYKQYSISAGDVFVSRANTRDLVGLASVAVASPNDRIIYPDLLIKLEVNSHLINPRYLAYALRTPESRRQIKDKAFGTSQSMVKISGERLKEVIIPVPPLDVQTNLINRYDELHDLAYGLVSELKTLKSGALKESILRKAFAGEL
jgi:type I restriction enzyme, S subunit